MRPGGVLLVIAGVWVLCQVLGGNALQRLGITAAAAEPDAPEFAVPDRGYNDIPHDAQGRPL